MTALNSAQLTDQLYSQLAQFPQIKTWWVAYSGGLDSTVLLDLAHQASLQQGFQLRVVHINHQLQADANAWSRHCEQRCADLGVPLEIRMVRVDVADGGLEAGARKARYAEFESLLTKRCGLLLAHHQNDQAETLLLRLIRGAGARGLSAMPASRPLGSGLLLRPLLDASREELEVYAKEQALSWVEDASNQSTDFDRNFIRQEIMPLLKGRWPEAQQSMAASAAYCAEAEMLNRELAELDWQSCRLQGLAGEGLSLPQLSSLTPSRQINLLRFWLSPCVDYLPNGETVRLWLEQMCSAKEDAMPRVIWEWLAIVRYRQGIYLIDPARCCDAEVLVPEQLASQLPFVTFVTSMVLGQGVRFRPGQRLELSFRQGGEQYCLAGRAGRRSLKKLFQERSVPPWLRGLLPVLLVDAEPAALLGLPGGPVVFEGFQVEADESGLYPCWSFAKLKKQQRS